MVERESIGQLKQLRPIEPFIAKLEEIQKRSDEIPSERKQFLEDAATLIASALSERMTPTGDVKAGDTGLGLNFICTHNSRRSHLSQVWAAVAAAVYGLDEIRCFSGGTEATACNPRIVRSLRRAGFSIVTSNPLEANPLYLLQFSEVHTPVSLHSKRYDDPCNGEGPFIAMMCCDHADQNCPVIAGSVGRVALHYRDPKESDDTDRESATYDERRDEIGAEMLFFMRMVAEKESGVGP